MGGHVRHVDLDRLRDIVGADQVCYEAADCWPYGYDNSKLHALPEAVVFAIDHEQVVAITRLCYDARIPLIARGRGTGTTGATVPTAGGIVLSLERMNRIVEVDAGNRYIVCEPGVTNQEIQDAAGRTGFFWPPDPTSAAFCSIGGNLAYNSAGPRAVKYGTPRENTLGLRAVTGNGETIRTGVYTTKGVVGYDLTRLLIGSEGTLATITEATLRLTPKAEAVATIEALFRDIESAAEAVARIMAQPITPCALEFMDKSAIDMVRHHTEIEIPAEAGALLIIEVDGPASLMEEACRAISDAASVDGLLRIKTATDRREAGRLWHMRKALSPALRTVAPGKINEDVVVPVSRIPELIARLEALGKRFGIRIVNFGHAGNGNIHVNLLVNPNDAAEMKRAHECLDAVFETVLTLRGTLSGEHGVGLVKKEYVGRELDRESLAIMRDIKARFDPHNILNPGKMFPTEAM
ncbi:MAG: FAD-binding protein [Gammaproteobacteria bacterium]|nr:FAD-binding protein [Gammaproteobacteria bacterium]